MPFNTDDLKKFISDTLDKVYDNPSLYSKESVKESINYRIDLLEEK